MNPSPNLSRLPVLFVSHGSPMFAVEPGQVGPQLRAIGERIGAAAKAIVVVSPHWMTSRGILTTGTAQPETIHDFGGFPQALYELNYPAPGEPALAQAIAARLADAGFETGVDSQRGLDHGAWVPLMYLAPQAATPVVQVSMPHPMTPETAVRLGRALAALREQGVLVVASGSLTHNLYELRRQDQADAEYVREFVAWARDAVARRDLDALAHYRERAPHALRAHPTDEHYWPLVIAMAASHDDDAVEIVDGGITYGTLSMDAYVLGQVPAAALAA